MPLPWSLRRGRLERLLPSVGRPPLPLPPPLSVRWASARASPSRAADEATYRLLSPLEHVLLRPGMYVGATGRTNEHAWVVDGGTSGGMAWRPVSYCPALLKIFDEVLVNALDNVSRDPAGTTHIDVSIGARPEPAPLSLPFPLTPPPLAAGLSEYEHDDYRLRRCWPSADRPA